MGRSNYDVAIIGGGFYGCCLALAFRGVTDNVVLIEREGDFLTRASRVNQARIHTGFHYPRSFVTALRSLQLHQKFARDFPEAVVDDFVMLYAIARRSSKVSASRFEKMYRSMNAPIERASYAKSALFDADAIESVFEVREWAFDYRALRQALQRRMEERGIEVRLNTEAVQLTPKPDGNVVELADGNTIHARTVFNVTYAMLNSLLLNSNLAQLPLKHEFTELTLVTPPPELEKLGVTVMDGPFFSIMPFPSRGLHSFTHVRFTPRQSWIDAPRAPNAYDVASSLSRESRWRHMMMDARRLMPCLADIRWQDSEFEVKTVLLKTEETDARPILLHRHEDAPNLFSVLGGKIDNIYDLMEALPAVHARWAALGKFLQ